MRVALLQINPTAGDLEGNASLIMRGARAAQAQGVDLMVTPELALMGYLPRDLLMNQRLRAAQLPRSWPSWPRS